jgi:hypothetical protein
MTCIKTSPADLYVVGDCVIIRWNPMGIVYNQESTRATHTVNLPPISTGCWHRDDLGVTVVTKDCIQGAL